MTSLEPPLGEPLPARDEPGAGDPAAHEACLRRGFAAGRDEYGPLPLGYEAYARRILEHARRRLAACDVAVSSSRWADAVERAHARDLFLSTACDAGVEGAWEVLGARVIPTLRPVALRRGASPTESGEILDELPSELCAPPPRGGARTRIGTYDGSSSLFAWLAVIVARRVVDRHRARRIQPATGFPGTSPDGEDDPLEVATGGASVQPLERLEAGEGVERFRRALGEAWTGLSEHESLALLWKHRDGLSQRDIGRVLGVGESRVSRLVRRALAKLRTALRHAEFRGPLGVGEPAYPALRDAIQIHLTALAPPSDILRKDRSSHG